MDERQKRIFERIKVYDRQLSEDKRLFAFLIDESLVSEEGKKLIEELVWRHIREFESWEKK